MSFAPIPSQYDTFVVLRAFLLAILPSGIEVVRAQENSVSEPVGPDFVVLTPLTRERISLDVTTYADCAFVGSAAGTTLTVSSVRLGSVHPGAILLGTGIPVGTAIGAQITGTPGGSGTYAIAPALPSFVPTSNLASGAALILQPIRLTIQIDVHGPASGDNAATITTLFRSDYAGLWFVRQGYTSIAPLYCGEPRQMSFTNAEENYEDRWSIDTVLQVNQVVSPSQDFADNAIVSLLPADIVLLWLPSAADFTIASNNGLIAALAA